MPLWPIVDGSDVSLTSFTDEELAEELLTRCTGLDVNNPQETDTPRRYVTALKEMTTRTPFDFTVFESNIQDMVIVRDIPVHSMCRHHVLSFQGRAHIGYIPEYLMAGLSKLARCVKYHAAALQTQEELTDEIADDLVDELKPVGVAVVLECTHTCMSIRGVQAPGALTYTAAMRGVFMDHDKTAKQEFMARINTNGRH
jgi:GTP cyclohydrolase I